MRVRSAGIVLGLAFALATSAGVGASTTIDYSKVTTRQTVEYDSSLQVVLENVNALDYVYTFKIEFELPKPRPIPGSHPALPGGSKAPLTKPDPCIESFHKTIATRRVVFGVEKLAAWFKAAKFDCTDTALRTKLQAVLDEQAARQDAGVTMVPSESLSKVLAQTGPGGAVVITVVAAVQESTYNDKLELTTKPLDPIPPEEKKAIEEHQQERKIRLEFGPPKGVEFSFGPYLAGINRQEYDQIANPSFDPGNPASSEFIIGTTEDSNYSYGVAAYWNSALTTNERWGIAWGVAYSLSNELDTAISGLIGAYWRPPNKKAAGLIHAGIAVGRERTLAGGRTIGGPIGESQEIPTTLKTSISWFAGYGFTF